MPRKGAGWPLREGPAWDAFCIWRGALHEPPSSHMTAWRAFHAGFYVQSLTGTNFVKDDPRVGSPRAAKAAPWAEIGARDA